jgi:putative drug exporter of the RND superfamily
MAFEQSFSKVIMANLLYKLGQLSARRAWLVIVSWILILGATIGLMVSFAGTLSTTMSLPGTPSQVVIDDLKKSFPLATNASGQVVFHKTDGVAFNASEKQQVADLLAKVKSQSTISDALNPFVTEAKLVKNRADLADGQAKLKSAPADLKSAQAKVDSGKKALAASQRQLNDGKAKLEAAAKDLTVKLAQVNGGIAQMKAAGAPQAQIDALLANQAQILAGQAEIAKQKQALIAGQAKIDAGAKALADGQKQIDQGKADLVANTSKLASAEKILAAMKDFHTVSTDGKTATVSVQFNKSAGELSSESIASVAAFFEKAKIANVQVELSQSLTKTLPSIGGPAEIIGLLSAAVVLFVMLGTLIAAGLPVLGALIGVAVSATGALSLSSLVEMNSTTPMLGVMLGLAVGIDYSLFILNRHRRQLKSGVEMRESIGLANGTSGNAVVFAGLTVIIALVALNVTGVGFLGLMGSVGAISIVVAVMVAVTFTPAMLSLVGRRVLSKKERSRIGSPISEHEAVEPKNSDRPVLSTRKPWLSILVVAILMGIAAQPLSALRLGLPDGSSEPTSSTQYKSFKLTEAAFGAGVNGPIIAVATAPNQVTGQKATDLQANIATDLMKLPSVVSVIPAAISADKTKLLFQIIPTDGPASASTEKLVFAIRDSANELKSKYGVDLGVTGATAAQIDISKKLADALPLYLGAVLILSMFVLILVFRSLLLPLIASAGFLLTVMATLGSTVAVFQWGWLGAVFGIHDPGPIMSFVPTLIIGVVFGLAMDYQLFLGSGMREAYVHGKSAKDAVNFGMHLSSRVVIAAAIIMVTVFGGFAFSDSTTIRPIGFGLAVGVLFDAFLVRLVLIPAIMALIGKSAWWIPKWLDRILPDVDVEGAALEREHLH